jgi:hypothetical protein
MTDGIVRRSQAEPPHIAFGLRHLGIGLPSKIISLVVEERVITELKAPR